MNKKDFFVGGCFLFQNFSSFWWEKRVFSGGISFNRPYLLRGTDGSLTCLEFCEGGRLWKRDHLDFFSFILFLSFGSFPFSYDFKFVLYGGECFVVFVLFQPLSFTLLCL